MVALGFSPTGLAWVVNAFLVAFAGLLLLAGRLGDVIGAPTGVPGRAGGVHPGLGVVRRRDRPGGLVAGRFVQGAGGA
jgi:hypothetical protein